MLRGGPLQRKHFLCEACMQSMCFTSPPLTTAAVRAGSTIATSSATFMAEAVSSSPAAASAPVARSLLQLLVLLLLPLLLPLLLTLLLPLLVLLMVLLMLPHKPLPPEKNASAFKEWSLLSKHVCEVLAAAESLGDWEVEGHFQLFD